MVFAYYCQNVSRQIIQYNDELAKRRTRRDAGMGSQNSNLNFIIEIAKSLTVFTERPFLKGEFE